MVTVTACQSLVLTDKSRAVILLCKQNHSFSLLMGGAGQTKGSLFVEKNLEKKKKIVLSRQLCCHLRCQLLEFGKGGAVSLNLQANRS